VPSRSPILLTLRSSKGAVTIILTLLSVGCSATASSPTGVIHMTPAIVDVSSDSDESMVASVSVSNTGQQPILIHGIDTPCACTQLIAADRQIEAGRTGSIQLKVQTPAYGVRDSWFRLRTSAGTVTVPVRLRGKGLTPPFLLSSGREWEIEQDETSSADVVLVPIELECIEECDAEPWLLELQPSTTAVAVSAPEVITTDKIDEGVFRRLYRFAVVFNSEAAGSNVARREVGLKLRTRTPAARPVPVLTASVRYRQPVRAVPSPLVIDLGSGDDFPVSREVRIELSKSIDWPELHVKTRVDWLRAEIKDFNGDPHQKILEVVIPERFEPTKPSEVGIVEVFSPMDKANALRVEVFVIDSHSGE